MFQVTAAKRSRLSVRTPAAGKLDAFVCEDAHEANDGSFQTEAK